jgi:chaperonin GroES
MTLWKGGGCRKPAEQDRSDTYAIFKGIDPYTFRTNGPKKGEKTMNLRPLQDRILVQRVEEEQTTKGGIIIPDTAKEKPAEGKVVAVGNGKVGDDGKRVPLEIKKDDRVLFGKYSGTEVKIDGEEYLIMREDDVLGVIE